MPQEKSESTDFTVYTVDMPGFDENGDDKLVPLPISIRADSERAKGVFQQWGVDPEKYGIMPPLDPMDFINSIPQHWVMAVKPAEEKVSYTNQEITLPQPRVMVH